MEGAKKGMKNIMKGKERTMLVSGCVGHPDL